MLCIPVGLFILGNEGSTSHYIYFYHPLKDSLVTWKNVFFQNLQEDVYQFLHIKPRDLKAATICFLATRGQKNPNKQTDTQPWYILPLQ